VANDIVLLCNGAVEPKKKRGYTPIVKSLDYRSNTEADQKIRIRIPLLLKSVAHLPPRLLDLLEIASYVYSADRLFRRGARDQVDYSSWSRRFRFIVKVSDVEFWSCPRVTSALSRLLQFLGGDASYDFIFQPGFERQPETLFDNPEHGFEFTDAEILLFSGGVDSLAGAIDLLQTQEKPVCLVSHKSGSPSTSKTQRQLIEALRVRFPNRIEHVAFDSGLAGVGRAPEETQRTRFFLYCSMALAVATARGQDHFSVFENGVTSIHLRKRQDLVNARATRTTHPKTIKLLRELCQLVAAKPFALVTPYEHLTKTDVMLRLSEQNGSDLLSSSVSCAKTIKVTSGHTHCGECSQCVDRRFAAYAAGLSELDSVGLYAFDVTLDEIEPFTDVRTVVNDFLYQASEFRLASEDHYNEGDRLSEVSELAEGFEDVDPEAFVTQIHDLCKRHGDQVWKGYEVMRTQHGDPSRPRPNNSLYSMVEGGEIHKEPEFLLAERLQPILESGIRLAFQRERPSAEHALNDQIEALLRTAGQNVEREFPSITFATKKSIPDHATAECRVLIEAKYPRKSRPLKAIIGEMEKDLFDFAMPAVILFVIYDPDGMIKSDTAFRDDFEKKGRSRVCITR